MDNLESTLLEMVAYGISFGLGMSLTVGILSWAVFRILKLFRELI